MKIERIAWGVVYKDGFLPLLWWKTKEEAEVSAKNYGGQAVEVTFSYEIEAAFKDESQPLNQS